MTTPRCAMGAVVTGGKIYVTGGGPSSSIECYDPTVGHTGRWTVVSKTSEFENAAKIS
jgi:hypothetical protein